MAHVPRIVAICSELVDGKKCGGNMKENFVKKKTYFLSSIIFLLSGDENLVGYMCDKCGAKQPLRDPWDMINSLGR